MSSSRRRPREFFGTIHVRNRRLKVATGFHLEKFYSDNECYELPVIDYEDVTAEVTLAAVGIVGVVVSIVAAVIG